MQPKTPQQKLPLAPALIRKLAASRFLTTSLVIHVTLISLLGGVVLFKAAQQKDDFVAVGNEGILSEVATEAPPEPEAVPEFEEQSASSSEPSAASSASAIQTLSTGASFTIAAAPTDTQVFGSNVGISDRALSGVANSGRAPGSSGVKLSNSLFGSEKSRTDALAGYFYDLKQSNQGTPNNIDNNGAFWIAVREIIDAKFSPAAFSPYFRAPKILYSSQWTLPEISAAEAPQAFGVADRVKPMRWLAHYSGKIAPTRSQTIRFAGYGDNLLMVAIDGRLVLDASRPDGEKSSDWQSNQTSEAPLLSGTMVIGDSVELQSGRVRKIDVLIGESTGGSFGAYLLVRRSGSKDKALPFFATSPGELPPGVKDAVVGTTAEVIEAR